MLRKIPVLILLLLSANAFGYTRQDTLRGSNGRGRDWWDVLKYDLTVQIDTATRRVRGNCRITYKLVGQPRDSMQIDLQDGMEITDRHNDWRHDGNVYWRIMPAATYEMGSTFSIDIPFEGKPRQAVNPPWDGGFIWTKDSSGNPWIAVACQGLGASCWWPCKDYQGDEPDSGVSLSIWYAIKETNDVSNGKPERIPRSSSGSVIIKQKDLLSNSIFWNLWAVRNPINTYDVTFYIGNYTHWHDTLHGEKGILDLDFYPLKYNEAKARKQWMQVKEMLRCFEYWMGPYPFYEDGYKLVEAPYLGMEHQSAVAYGNSYKNGYRRPDGSMIDRSGTGVGFSFDFIIIHESGHEWFGNNITAQDIADNWLHEGFTTYTETLFAERVKGKDSAFAYVMGQQHNIRNDRPVIDDYGVNHEGSGDMYDKGAQVVHMIRMMLNDDKKFRELLRGLNRDFYHKIVTTKEVEAYISRFTGRDLRVFFDVYLRSTIKPTLHCRTVKGQMSFEWLNAPKGFIAPFCLRTDKDTHTYTDIPKDIRYLLSGNTLHAPQVISCGWYDIMND